MRQDRIKVTLPKGWEQIDNPDGPATFTRIADPTGAFQVSQALYESGVVPNPTHADLIDLSRKSAESLGFQVIQTGSGKCAMGDFGLSISKKGPSTMWLWHLSNGRDFLFATFIAESPSMSELADAESIVRELTLAESRPFWKFW